MSNLEAVKTTASKPSLSTSGVLQRTCVSCGQHTPAGGGCTDCGKKRGLLQHGAIKGEAPPIAGSPDQPLDTAARAFTEPRLSHNFSRVRAHTDMRGRGPEDVVGVNIVDNRMASANRGGAKQTTKSRGEISDQRPGRGVEDPLHQPMIDVFREQQGQPPGGVDEEGNQVAPTDAEIKYRPQPIALLNGPFHAPIDTPTTIGMEIQIGVQMSSNNAELPFVQDSEKVGLSFNHTGSMVGVPPMPSNQSGFMSAAGIPNDRHGIGRAWVIDRADNHGGTGSFDKHQLDVYNHARYGIFNPIVIPNSGYKITRTVTAGPGTRLVFRVDKVPEACTVDGFSTTAGPSPAQHDEVVLRA